MTPKQSQQALAKSMKALENSQEAVAGQYEYYCDMLGELERAKQDVAEKQAAFVSAHKIPSEE